MDTTNNMGKGLNFIFRDTNQEDNVATMIIIVKKEGPKTTVEYIGNDLKDHFEQVQGRIMASEGKK